MNLLFNKQFINESMTDFVSGKIHTIRANYNYWKKWDGKEISIRVWKDKPYRSKQIEVCKKVIHVQRVCFHRSKKEGDWFEFYIENKGISSTICVFLDNTILSQNDGFEYLFPENHGYRNYNALNAFYNWFNNYQTGEMAILHFTDFRY